MVGARMRGVRMRVRRSKQNAQAKTYGIIMAVGHTGQPLGFLEKRKCRRRRLKECVYAVYWMCRLGLNGKGSDRPCPLATDEMKLRL
jgi:hypothetical protein